MYSVKFIAMLAALFVAIGGALLEAEAVFVGCTYVVDVPWHSPSCYQLMLCLLLSWFIHLIGASHKWSKK